MIEQEALTPGLALLRQPVLPLVGIVQFLFLTGDFATVEEVIGQLPGDIETNSALYRDPAADLAPYVDLLQPLVALKGGMPPPERVISFDGQPLDPMTATTALVAQRILTRELERINSLLCAPCGCTLCCIGPERAMVQSYFEIPLQENEIGLFQTDRIENETARMQRPDDEPPLQADGHDFFDRSDPLLIRWQPCWSLMLPRGSRCPNLELSGRCLVYPDRPQVCRRPQIFPYMVEPVEEQGQLAHRLRQTLLAVMDCPYVRQLQDEIAAYAAACELEIVFRHNKA
jgi:Fe-S-cluster containining protein